MDRKTILLYVVLGSIGAIFFVAILGTITGAQLISTFGAFQKAFMGKVIKFSIASSEKAFSLAQGTITTVGNSSLAAISLVSSTTTAIQKSLFETTFFVAKMAGIAVEGAVTTVKELLEVMTRITEKLVSLVSKFANASIEMVSKAMKATAKMLSKTEDTLKKFSFEAVVPAITKAFNLTKDMAMNVGKIMGKIIPLYMNIIKRSLEVTIGSEIFMVGLYAVSAYVSVMVTMGKGFLDKLFGTSVIEIIINSLRGLFTNILVGEVNPISICNIITTLIYPVFAPIVAPNIPLFGSTLKRCDRQLIRIGLATITKGKLCKKFPITAAQAISCLLEKVGNIQILPKIPRIAFGPRDLMQMVGINPKVFGKLGGLMPSIGIGPFGPFTINEILSGIRDALASFMDMAMREVTKNMKSMSAGLGSAFKTVSFAISNPRPAGEMTVEARNQTTTLLNAANSLTSTINSFGRFPVKYPDYDLFLSSEMYPLILSLVSRVRLIPTADITFSEYITLYETVLSTQIRGTLGNEVVENDDDDDEDVEKPFRIEIEMNDHGYRISERIWIETSDGFVSTQIISTNGRNRFIVDTRNIINTPRIFEAPPGFADNTDQNRVPMIDVENFLLRVIRKKMITRFFVDSPFLTAPVNIGKIVSFQNVLYGIGLDEHKQLWVLTNNLWTITPNSRTGIRDVSVDGDRLVVATVDGVYIRNQTNWNKISDLTNVYSLAPFKLNEIVVGGEGRVDIINYSSGTSRNILNEVDGPILSIAVTDDADVIYIGGDFFTLQDATFNLVAGYNVAESTWFALRNGVNETTPEPKVDKLILNSGRLIAYGTFIPVYIYDLENNIWNRFRPPTPVVSDFILDDGTILFCLESGALMILYPNSITLIDVEIELTMSGSLFQDAENIYINGKNRINLNNIRLSSPTVSGLIKVAGGLGRSTVKLFAGTTLTIGNIRTVVTSTDGYEVALSPPVGGLPRTVSFVGRIPSISEEISNIYFANMIGSYTLSSNGRQFSGVLNIDASGKVTTEQEVTIGTIITTNNNFRTKVIEISSSSNEVILNPPFPQNLFNTSVQFIGLVPTLISFLDEVVRLNPSNTYVSNNEQREAINRRLRELFADFVDNSTVIPQRYLDLKSFESEIELVATLITTTPELILTKFRAAGIDTGENASIVTLLITAFRQMLRSMLRRVFKIWQDARDLQISFLKNLPGIPSFSFCLFWFIKCRLRITTPSINFHTIATRVSSLIDSIVLKLMDLTDSFLDKLMGPSANNSATPEFDYP